MSPTAASADEKDLKEPAEEEPAEDQPAEEDVPVVPGVKAAACGVV
jgi:hypothetical protein